MNDVIHNDRYCDLTIQLQSYFEKVSWHEIGELFSIGHMKKIESDIHGLIDYLVALFLIISATLMNISAAEALLLICSGSIIIVYSVGTDYFLGIFKFLPMSTHLYFDIVAGILLVVCSWLLDSGNFSSVIVFISGTVLIVIAMRTQTHPAYEFLRLHRKKLKKVFKRKNIYTSNFTRHHSRIGLR